MNPDFDNASHNETLNTSTEEESRLVLKAMARRKIEEYSEEKSFANKFMTI